MARGHTYGNKDNREEETDAVGSILDDFELPSLDSKAVEDKPVDTIEKLKQDLLAQTQSSHENIENEESVSIKSKSFIKKKSRQSKLFTLDVDIVQIIDDLFIDENGERIKGSRGMNSILAQNGIIRELVAIGVLDKTYLKRLRDY